MEKTAAPADQDCLERYTWWISVAPQVAGYDRPHELIPLQEGKTDSAATLANFVGDKVIAGNR